MKGRCKLKIKKNTVIAFVLISLIIAALLVNRMASLHSTITAFEEQPAMNAYDMEFVNSVLADSSIPEPAERKYTYYDIPLSYELQQYTQDLCRRYGVDYELILAIMKTESNFNPCAVGGSCYGLMQIHKSGFAWLEETYDLQPVIFHNDGEAEQIIPENIEAGIIIYKMYLDEYGSQDKALIRYNSTAKYAKGLLKKGVTENKYTRKVYENLGIIKELKL